MSLVHPSMSVYVDVGRRGRKEGGGVEVMRRRAWGRGGGSEMCDEVLGRVEVGQIRRCGRG